MRNERLIRGHPGEHPAQEINELLQSRTALVTGADGFVGSHLVEALLGYGAEVHALVRPTSSGMLNNLGHIRSRLQIHRADITDKQSVLQVLKRVAQASRREPVIFHLAGQSHVGESWHRLYETVAANTLGTLNLLQSIVDLDLQVFKFDTAGSSEEYGNVDPELKTDYRFGDDGGLILDTTSPLNPQSVYATSKVAADFLTRNYHAAYGVPAIVTRMFNNYGPRQNPRFVTGTIITQALSRNYVELGYLGAKRDFCFVKDGAQGHIHATLFGIPGQVYVYGSGEHISIDDWYRLIIKAGQEGGFWKDCELRIDESVRGRLGNSEVQELRVDFGKLARLSGWRPQFSWQEGLTETIRWYAENRDRWIGRVDWN
jgi:dTDP-glucose 4,6-dehydratase